MNRSTRIAWTVSFSLIVAAAASPHVWGQSGDEKKAKWVTDTVKKIDANSDGSITPEEMNSAAGRMMEKYAKQSGLDLTKPVAVPDMTAKVLESYAGVKSAGGAAPTAGTTPPATPAQPATGTPASQSSQGPQPTGSTPAPATGATPAASGSEATGSGQPATSTPSTTTPTTPAQPPKPEPPRVRSFGDSVPGCGSGAQPISYRVVRGKRVENPPSPAAPSTASAGSRPTGPAKGKKNLQPALPDWFGRLDDGDGQITMQEYARELTSAKEAEFHRYDKNGDGLISPDEAIRLGK